MAFTQEGYVRGNVLDKSTGEPLFGATVVKLGTSLGAVADFDGNYSLALPAGKHTIVFQSIGFKNVVVESVNIESGKATILDMVMDEDVQQLGEIVVTAEVVKDNDVGVLLVQKKSINTLDGISSSTFRKIGDSDLSGAMKRVTGVSVQGGKYVYVRGLGDRYTKTSVNGLLIPGLDPDRNDVQIDIFPTSILENVLVYKTFSPDLPGSFTGGLIDIQTKSFPDEKTTTASISLGYNPDMNLNSDYITYEGSSTDFLGFDNGDRDLPVTSGVEILNDNATTRLFNPTLGGDRKKSFLNSSVSFAHRNQIAGNKITWGYNALFTYRNNYRYYKDFERRRYERQDLGDGIDIFRDYTSKGDLASNEVLWSGLASLAAKTTNTTLDLTFIHIQNGVTTSLDRTRENTSLNNPTFLYNDILTYTQRSLSDLILSGKHKLGKWKINWANALIWSNQYEPDYREVNINLDDDQLGFRNGGFINRFWRDLSEVNENFKLDFTNEINKNNKLKFGGLLSHRDRKFDVFTYNYINLNVDDVSSTDPNELLQEDNIVGSTENPRGPAINNATTLSNLYEGTYTITAGYVMNEMKITEKLKSIYGVRVENAIIKYTGLARLVPGEPAEQLTNEKTLNETNLLPSLNMIYSINDDMNVRASFNKTLARPSFKEKSAAIIDDPITGILFIGNVNTKQAQIQNYDLRWEYFFTPSEMFSATVFYKDFTDHIAIVAFDVAPNQVTPRNVGSAKAYGLEFEFRKNLGFLQKSLENFQLGGNFTYTVSKVDRFTVPVSEDGQSEFDSEVETRNGDTNGVDRFRDMSQQAPFSINTFINYEQVDKQISANLSYNVQGRTLTYVSSAEVPEVYTEPFQSLNFKISKGIGERSNVSFRVQNILNDNRELFYDLDGQQELFSRLSPGTNYTLKYSVKF